MYIAPRKGKFEMIEWKPELSVGHLALDDDHKAFFSLAALLNDIEASDADEEMVVLSAISLLQEYVTGHFLREEMAMRSAKYPATDAHISEHVQFKQQVLSIIDDFNQGNAGAAHALGELTAKWLYQHIMSTDLKYVDWVEDKDVDSRPLGLMLADYGRNDDHDVDLLNP